MNRRTYIKRIVALAAVALSAIPFVKWFVFQKDIDWKIFADQEVLIGEIAETIIPETDTPGAMKAGVAGFIKDMVRDCLSLREQRNFMHGLDALERYCADTFNRSFIRCSTAERIAALEYFEAKAEYQINVINKIVNRIWGKPFIVTIKELTIEGYCTSEAGATLGLAYDYIPVYYTPCTRLERGQRAWATK